MFGYFSGRLDGVLETDIETNEKQTKHFDLAKNPGSDHPFFIVINTNLPWNRIYFFSQLNKIAKMVFNAPKLFRFKKFEFFVIDRLYRIVVDKNIYNNESEKRDKLQLNI